MVLHWTWHRLTEGFENTDFVLSSRLILHSWTLEALRACLLSWITCSNDFCSMDESKLNELRLLSNFEALSLTEIDL